MWIDADLRPLREKVYFRIMRSIGFLLLCWSLPLAWSALCQPPQIDMLRYFETIITLIGASFFVEFASLFRHPDDDRRDDPPEAPAPWPQSPEVIVLDLVIKERQDLLS
jgi:hypothetical protein